MDYCMPFLDGCASTIMIRQYLQQNAPKLEQPYVVCLTSYADKTFKKEALKAGMDYFQAKPIFNKGIQKLLAKAQLIREWSCRNMTSIFQFNN